MILSKSKKMIAVLVGLEMGIAFASTAWEDYHYTEKEYVVRLKKGDSIYGVAERYYEANENGECYDEFRTRVGMRNRKLLANGRVPQVGDEVVVPVMVRK